MYVNAVPLLFLTITSYLIHVFGNVIIPTMNIGNNPDIYGKPGPGICF